MEEIKEEVSAIKVETETPEKKPAKKKAVNNPVYQKIRKQAEQYAEALGSMTEKFREFKLPGLDGTERIFRVYSPSPKIESNVNNTYTKVYGKLMQDDDCLPQAQIIELMKKRGLWSDNKDKRIDTIQERLTRLRGMILINGETMTSSEMETKADEFSKLELELNELNSQKSVFIQNSIENRAYEAKIKDQLWQCVKQLDASGNENLLWKSLEEIDNETDRILIFRIMTECITFWQGVPSEFLDEKPELTNGENDTP